MKRCFFIIRDLTNYKYSSISHITQKIQKRNVGNFFILHRVILVMGVYDTRAK